MWRLKTAIPPREPWFVPQRDTLTWTRPPHKKDTWSDEFDDAAAPERTADADIDGEEEATANREPRRDAADTLDVPVRPMFAERLDEWSPYPYDHPARRRPGEEAKRRHPSGEADPPT